MSKMSKVVYLSTLSLGIIIHWTEQCNEEWNCQMLFVPNTVYILYAQFSSQRNHDNKKGGVKIQKILENFPWNLPKSVTKKSVSDLRGAPKTIFSDFSKNLEYKFFKGRIEVWWLYFIFEFEWCLMSNVWPLSTFQEET